VVLALSFGALAMAKETTYPEQDLHSATDYATDEVAGRRINHQATVPSKMTKAKLKPREAGGRKAEEEAALGVILGGWRHLSATVGSWTDLAWAMPPDWAHQSATITLDKAFNFDYSGIGAIEIPIGNVTIHGNGAVLDAAKKGRFFSITGTALPLQHMVLRYGHQPGGGRSHHHRFWNNLHHHRRFLLSQ
jgi:hypothetical protein